ncbi:MAG: hypothetical protein M0008_00990 [Actinomycetota bacterium]|nr:hypothetical protein [Actinomycetota bacterium]
MNATQDPVEVTLTDPAYWTTHVDQLLDALSMATRLQAPSAIPAETATPEPVLYAAEQQPTASYPDEPVETPPSPIDEESGDDSDHLPAVDTPADLLNRLTLTGEDAVRAGPRCVSPSIGAGQIDRPSF